ncbi:MAG: Xaa-Pro peptidase family protein [Dehalobacterium sp.]
MKTRIDKVLKVMEDHEVDALFLMRKANIRYVSGFTGTDSYVVLAKHARIFITDSRYTEQAEQECPEFEIYQHRNGSTLEDTVAQICWKFRIKKLGFEQDFITFEIYDKINNALDEIEFIPTSGIVENVRAVKGSSEIKLIERAAQIADDAFTDILGFIKPGITEMDIERELEYLIKKKGALSVSFPTIVASGPRSSLPHAIPTDRKIQRGDFITLDFGALYEGYCSDMTRTVVMGEPSAKQKEIYQIVREAQEAGVKAVRAGVRGIDGDKFARDVIEKAGYGEYFGHGLGHGIGLEIHEEPNLNKRNEKMLCAGSVVTVEPGIYLPHWGGVRIEDSVVVTADGCEILTHSSKDLIVL